MLGTAVSFNKIYFFKTGSMLRIIHKTFLCEMWSSCSGTSLKLNYSHAFVMLWSLGRQSFWRCSFFTSTNRTTSEFDRLTWHLYPTAVLRDWWTDMSCSEHTLLVYIRQCKLTSWHHNSPDLKSEYFRRVEKNNSYFELGS